MREHRGANERAPEGTPFQDLLGIPSPNAIVRRDGPSAYSTSPMEGAEAVPGRHSGRGAGRSGAGEARGVRAALHRRNAASGQLKGHQYPGPGGSDDADESGDFDFRCSRVGDDAGDSGRSTSL